ncbi:C40 family peptidase [Kitasatospora sp. NPDC059646]|uniref:C40 family peptidase n=1 Tax=Kitasatospora sp. NPDC059646 TaxID=3346893 RepID=UPI00369A04AF
MPKTGTREVVLRWGDTLWHLAQLHRTTVQALQELNGLGDSILIYAGTTLRVPAAPAGEERTEQPEAEKGEKPTAEETDPAPSTPAGGDPEHPGTTSSSGAEAVVAYARAQLGKPYAWGGTGPAAFDCSGLVLRAWQAAGLTLPRTTWAMRTTGTATGRDRLVPGDLVITNGGAHVQLYIGDGQVIHAPGRGKPVTTAPLPSPGRVTTYRHPAA